MRKVKDAVDLTTGEKIYFKGHAKATYLSDGRNVEEAIENLPSGDSSVFEAIYGETTYEEIIEAYNAGKYIVCLYEELAYHLSSLKNNAAWFGAIDGDFSFRTWCDKSNVWRKVQYNLELSSNKTRTISETSTDTQYPSAKAVYEALQNVGGGSDVFEAVYGVTTYDEIVEANNAGKEVVCNYTNWFARLARIQESRVILQAFSEGIIMILFCSNKNE